MIQQQANVSSGMSHKKELLTSIYRVYSRWVEGFSLACQKGCAACCTQSVTMTSLEGEIILDFLRERDRDNSLAETLAQSASGNNRAVLTTNDYAKACLEHQDIADDILGEWNFAPCVFLRKDVCSIYEARPFGCRSFGSLVRCSDKSGAEIVPIHVTVNTVFTQIVEHVCSGDGYWGNMTDVLGGLLENKTPDSAGRLLPAHPIPGFLLEPYEVKLIYVLLKQLCGQSEDEQTFSDLIDNFMPI